MISDIRTGQGWDNHRLTPGRPLILGGIQIESDFGFDGHSDADVLSHAITDALLGAIAAGDIGMHFPDTDPKWKGMASVHFLKQALGLVKAHGYRIQHVDSTVILERPKLKDYRDSIRQNIASTLGIDITQVSLKFKTSEKVGPVGEGKSGEAQSVVTLVK